MISTFKLKNVTCSWIWGGCQTVEEGIQNGSFHYLRHDSPTTNLAIMINLIGV